MIEDWESRGFCVINTSTLGGEVLDLFVGGLHRGLGMYLWVHVEVKGPGGRQTPGQKEFFRKWPELPSMVAHCTEDVLRWFEWVD